MKWNFGRFYEINCLANKGDKMNNNWMSPKDYFEHIVEPTLLDYWREETDHCKENAIFQLSSFAERHFKYHEEKGNVGKYLGQRNWPNLARRFSIGAQNMACCGTPQMR